MDRCRGIVPENTSPRIAWYRPHLPKWAEHAEALGLPAEQVALLEDRIDAAAQTLAAQIAVQQKAKAATAALHAAMDQLSELGSQMIQTIRARAANEGNGIYEKAMLPAPAQPSPIAAPGIPTGFKLKLGQVGDIEIKWRCSNPKGSEGTMYEIKRQLGRGPFETIAIVGKKKFYDASIPAGTPSVTYRITAFRSTRRGPSSNFTVFLGVDGIIPADFDYQTAKPLAA